MPENSRWDLIRGLMG